MASPSENFPILSTISLGNATANFRWRRDANESNPRVRLKTCGKSSQGQLPLSKINSPGERQPKCWSSDSAFQNCHV